MPNDTEDPKINREVLKLSIFAAGGTIIILNAIKSGEEVDEEVLDKAIRSLVKSVELLGYVDPTVNFEVSQIILGSKQQYKM